MALLFLDVKNTGYTNPSDFDFAEAALVDLNGTTVFHSLCKPGRPIRWGATQAHGITNAMVADAPSSKSIRDQVLQLVQGHDVVIYNAALFRRYLPGIARSAKSIHCCMERYVDWRIDWGNLSNDPRWPFLYKAASALKCKDPDMFRALGDARTCAAIWRYLDSQCPNEEAGEDDAEFECEEGESE